MRRPSEALSSSIPSAIAAGCGLLAFVLLRHGVELVVSFCALGGCGRPENNALGWTLIVAGLVVLTVGLGLATRLSNTRGATARALLALPAVAVVGLAAVASSVPDHGAWGQSVSLFALVLVFVGVVVPPRGRSWGVAAAAGALVAGLLGDWLALAVVGGTAVFLAAIAFTDIRGTVVSAREVLIHESGCRRETSRRHWPTARQRL